MIYSPELVRALSERHGLRGEPRLLPSGGMVNEAWLIGEEHVLRIAHASGADGEARREEAVVPLVRAAGVMAPELVAADSDARHAPRPYTVYERARGVLLGYEEGSLLLYEEAYLEIGRQIALLSGIRVPPSTMAVLHRGKRPNPAESLARSLAKGVIDQATAKDVSSWIESVRPLLGRCRRRTLLHQDIHPWNVFVDPASRRLTAIIDWGDAAFGDPAFEFASMPLVAVPPMLEGYREAGGAVDPGFVARTLWAGVSLALWEIRELDPDEFTPRWSRIGPGGWPGMRQTMAELFGL